MLYSGFGGKFYIMKHILSLTIILFCAAHLTAQTYNPFIQQKADEVNCDSVTSLLRKFESFGKKTPGTTALTLTANWIKSYYERLGYTDIRRDSFEYMNNPMCNIIITKKGKLYPETYLIVDAHYDTYNGTGTNDNGSGTAILMEIARLLQGTETNFSVKFIHFSAEEEGLIGSEHYVTSVANPSGMDIKLVFNIDEVGGVKGLINNTVTCERDEGPPQANNEASWAFTDTLATLTEMYTTLNTEISYAYGSDYVPFQQNGYIITGFYETNESPYVHSASDLLTNLDTNYVYRLAGASLAATLYFAEAYDIGSGIHAVNDMKDHLKVSPNPCENSTIVHALPGSTVTIYAFDGQKVYEGSIPSCGELKINTSFLSAGFYTLCTQHNDIRGRYSIKLVKN